MVYGVHLAWVGFDLTTLVVIGTDCIGSYKSNLNIAEFNMTYNTWKFVIEMGDRYLSQKKIFF
jgi:hypothetical protein